MASKSTLYSLVQTQRKAKEVKAKEVGLQRKLQMLEQRRAMLELLLKRAEDAETTCDDQAEHVDTEAKQPPTNKQRVDA